MDNIINSLVNNIDSGGLDPIKDPFKNPKRKVHINTTGLVPVLPEVFSPPAKFRNNNRFYFFSRKSIIENYGYTLPPAETPPPPLPENERRVHPRRLKEKSTSSPALVRSNPQEKMDFRESGLLSESQREKLEKSLKEKKNHHQSGIFSTIKSLRNEFQSPFEKRQLKKKSKPPEPSTKKSNFFSYFSKPIKRKEVRRYHFEAKHFDVDTPEELLYRSILQDLDCLTTDNQPLDIQELFSMAEDISLFLSNHNLTFPDNVVYI